MDNRLVAAAAVMLVAGVAGCSSPPAALGGTTAKVTINGENKGDANAVSCTQTGWTWTIKTPDAAKGFSAALDTGGEVTVESVNFHDFGGFTGTFIKGDIGDAEVTGNGGKFTITGSADGNFTETPSNAVTATFRIEASC
jgi:hypothetical protein